MTIRVRLNLTWTITFAAEGMPFSKLEDYYAHARNALVRPFPHYQPELSITVKERFGDSMADLDIVWDVNLDGVSGGYHFPRDYEAHAKFHLVDGIKIFAHRLKAEILRFPAAENDVDGATDLVVWDDAYRERSYAAFKARMDALDAQAA